MTVLTEVLRRAKRAVQHLNGQLQHDGIRAALIHHSRTLIVIEARIDAPPADRLSGYPAEIVCINIRPDGDIGAVPVGPDRPWLHRYPHVTLDRLLDSPAESFTWSQLTGPLCLQYPLDPRHLRWEWTDGLDTYLRIVQRHVWSEEYWRRRSTWPVEDAPHGTPPDETPHPIVTPRHRSAP